MLGLMPMLGKGTTSTPLVAQETTEYVQVRSAAVVCARFWCNRDCRARFRCLQCLEQAGATAGNQCVIRVT